MVELRPGEDDAPREEVREPVAHRHPVDGGERLAQGVLDGHPLQLDGGEERAGDAAHREAPPEHPGELLAGHPPEGAVPRLGIEQRGEGAEHRGRQRQEQRGGEAPQVAAHQNACPKLKW